MKKALIVRGGWDGHEPILVSERFKKVLEKDGFDVTIAETLDVYLDEDLLNSLHLIVPVVTMSDLSYEQVKPVARAVGNGVGMAGCHGGMCDSFRMNVEWQFMTGAQWVSHPGGDGVPYKVNIRQSSSSPIVEGLQDFMVASEQYYVHIDPCVDVLATTRYPVVNYYHASNGEVDVPVAFTKRWGHGRIFYNSLGHHDDVFEIPEAIEMMRRGFLWCAAGRDIALAQGLSGTDFHNEAKMY